LHCCSPPSLTLYPVARALIFSYLCPTLLLFDPAINNGLVIPFAAQHTKHGRDTEF